jgi:hypothetical protein
LQNEASLVLAVLVQVEVEHLFAPALLLELQYPEKQSDEVVHV